MRPFVGQIRAPVRRLRNRLFGSGAAAGLAGDDGGTAASSCPEETVPASTAAGQATVAAAGAWECKHPACTGWAAGFQPARAVNTTD